MNKEELEVAFTQVDRALSPRAGVRDRMYAHEALEAIKIHIAGIAKPVLSAGPLILAKEERAFWDVRFASHRELLHRTALGQLFPEMTSDSSMPPYDEVSSRARKLAASSADLDLEERRKRFPPPRAP